MSVLLTRALLCVAAAACSSPARPHQAAPESCAAAPSWRHERIELPPEFAPELPRGVERLYFAPQMFEPGTPGYWSYVFSLELDEPAPADAAALARLLERYYSGLIAAVAEANKLGPPGPAEVEVRPAGEARFTASVETVDAFTGGAPIEVTLDIRAAPRCLDVAASVSPPGGPIWSQLQAARRCVACGASGAR